MSSSNASKDDIMGILEAIDTLELCSDRFSVLNNLNRVN
jgi:hypothetical protein